MTKIYALSVDREQKEPYCIEMSLQEIDTIFCTQSKESILNKIKTFDSVMDEKDPDKLGIKVLANGKWKTCHHVPVVTDEVILTYSVPDVLDKLPKKDGYIKDILTHFQKMKKQETTSKVFRDIFETRMLSQKFYLLPYEEQRLIRVYLASKVNVYQMLGLDKKTDNLSLVLK